jgi:hypothetical protein
VRKSEFETYVELRRKLEQRGVELCRLYAKAYYGVEEDDRDIVITDIEVGRSGRVMFTYSVGDLDETLYLPPEYLWRTDEEVLVLMQLDSQVKDEAMKRQRARTAASQSGEHKQEEKEGMEMDSEPEVLLNLNCTSDLSCFIEYIDYDLQELRDMISDLDRGWVEHAQQGHA